MAHNNSNAPIPLLLTPQKRDKLEGGRRFVMQSEFQPAGDQPQAIEKLVAGFQAGLSWITILRKRPHFREVFAGFEPAAVAAFDEADVERLMADAGIIRNRGKILATIGNARLVLAMAPGELDALMWSFAPAPRAEADRPRSFADVPAVTAASDALSKTLRKAGFRFVGSTTMYALMQSAGMVDISWLES